MEKERRGGSGTVRPPRSNREGLQARTRLWIGFWRRHMQRLQEEADSALSNECEAQRYVAALPGLAEHLRRQLLDRYGYDPVARSWSNLERCITPEEYQLFFLERGLYWTYVGAARLASLMIDRFPGLWLHAAKTAFAWLYTFPDQCALMLRNVPDKHPFARETREALVSLATGWAASGLSLHRNRRLRRMLAMDGHAFKRLMEELPAAVCDVLGEDSGTILDSAGKRAMEILLTQGGHPDIPRLPNVLTSWVAPIVEGFLKGEQPEKLPKVRTALQKERAARFVALSEGTGPSRDAEEDAREEARADLQRLRARAGLSSYLGTVLDLELKGLSPEEIGTRLNRTPGAIRTAQTRIREKIRESM